MTTHYNIQITETGTDLKVTYRDNKFKKLEHLRGKLDDAMLRQLGRIVPRLESSIEQFKTAYKDKVTYTKIEKQKSLYSMFLSEWYTFYNTYSEGIEPKFTGADGNALKSIIAHLKKLSSNNDTEALALFKVILDKWHTLAQFHQDNTDLKYINSKLNIILNAIKKQNNTFSGKSGGSVQL